MASIAPPVLTADSAALRHGRITLAVASLATLANAAGRDGALAAFDRVWWIVVIGGLCGQRSVDPAPHQTNPRAVTAGLGRRTHPPSHTKEPRHET